MTASANGDWPNRPSWSNGVEDAPPRPTGSKKEEEEPPADKECSICFDADISVIFSPCNHGACTDCVTRLRREVIFKADKGMKCPFCRQFIEHHRNAGSTGDSKAKQALKDANQSAKMAAMARQAGQQQKRVVDQGEPSTIGKWQCSKCREDNHFSSKLCGRCRQVAPSFVLNHLASSKGPAMDVMKASPKLIREWARAKLHPNFNSAFAELGMPFDPEQARFEGNEKTIMAGIKAGHYKKTQRILDALLAENDVKLLTFDFYGNYTLQDIIALTARLRGTAIQMLKSKQINKTVFDDVMGLHRHKTDYFRRITAQVTQVSEQAILDAHGNYVMEKIVEYGDPIDIMTVTERIFEKPWDFFAQRVPHSRHAIVKAVKAVDRLNAFAFEEGEHQENCAKHLNKLCNNLLADNVLFNRLLYNDLGGNIILDAAQGGLSYSGAIKVLSRIAEDVRTLRTSLNGVGILKKFMSLESRNSECRENFITHVCIMAQNLSPEYAETANPKCGGPEIIQRMLELLSQEEDQTCNEWVTHIVSLLVESAKDLSKDSSTESLLIYGMSLPIVTDFVPSYLESIRDSCGLKKFLTITEALKQQVGEIPGIPINNPKSSEPPDPTPFDDPSTQSNGTENSIQSSPESLAPTKSEQIAQPEKEEDVTGFTVVKKGKKKGKNANTLSPEPSTEALTLITSQNPIQVVTTEIPTKTAQAVKKAEPYQIPHKKLKHLQSDKPNFESTFTDSPSAKVGDPLTLSTWRSNSNNLDEIKSKQSSPSESITLSPPSIQPNKIQTQGIQPGKIQAMSSHQSETVDDFSNDFLADLLPGLVLGGASAPEPKFVKPPQVQTEKQLEIKSPIQGRANGKTSYKPYVPQMAHHSTGQLNGITEPSKPPAYNPMSSISKSIPLQPPGLKSLPPEILPPPTSLIPPKKSLPPPQAVKTNNVVVTPVAPGGIKPARKAAQISSAQKNERTDSPSKSHLKPDANEFKPSNLKKTSNPNFKSEGNNSVRAQSSQSNRVDLKAKQNPIKSLKADAPAFQPRPSGNGVASNLGSSRASSNSSLGAPRSSSTNSKQVTSEGAWSCQFCTYKHEGSEAGFLTCALCLQARP